MRDSSRIVSVFALVVASTISVFAQAPSQFDRHDDRQINSILERLDKSTNRFRDSLNLALVLGHIDETRPQNDINSFEGVFESTLDQFRDQFNRRLAAAADVESVLRKASPVNGFMTRNRLSSQAQSDWTAVRNDLSALATSYGVVWQWHRQITPPVSSKRSLRLSGVELSQLIRRIETGGNRFRASLTDALAVSRYEQTTNEATLKESTIKFRKATEQLRDRFDAGQAVTADVRGLLDQAALIDRYMRINQLTPGAQYDWSMLRTDLETLAVAHSVSLNWQKG